jgi:hypothetical protein
MMNKMKVFSREKYLRDMERITLSKQVVRVEYEWPFECDGKTKEECNALGYGISPDWMEEKEMGYEEKQKQWLKANNLREGSRVYVYRKPENYEDGWGYMWIDSLMDETVGKVASIVDIKARSLEVKIGNKYYYLSYTALLPVGVTEFEVGRRYKYVGNGGAREFRSIAIDTNDAELLGRGCELMVEEFNGLRVKFTVFSREWNFMHTWKDFVALPEKDYYAELNRWINANKLKVGDKVRLLRSPTLVDMEGWECNWDDCLDKYVGQVGIVDFYYGDNEIIATFSDSQEVFVPYTVLEKVQCDIYLELSKALNAVGILAMSAKVEGNHITIEGVIR